MQRKNGGGQRRPGEARGGQGRPGEVRGGQGRPGEVRGGQGRPRGGQGRPGEARGGQGRLGTCTTYCVQAYMQAPAITHFANTTVGVEEGGGLIIPGTTYNHN